MGTATARRPVCLWPASRVAFAGCTSGAAGKGRVACGGQAKPDSFRNFFGRESRGAAGAATRGDGRVPLQGTCVWGVVRAGGRRSVIGRFHQPADAGPFANARLRRPTWSTAPSAVFPSGRRPRRVRRPGLPHGSMVAPPATKHFSRPAVRVCIFCEHFGPWGIGRTSFHWPVVPKCRNQDRSDDGNRLGPSSR